MKRRCTVLVVDDDKHFRDLYRNALQWQGFEVTTASDGLAALMSIQANPPSFVILDIHMPCVDGWAVLRELASNNATKGIPVIVVTAQDVDRAVDQAIAILKKPCFPDEIIPYIEKHAATM